MTADFWRHLAAGAAVAAATAIFGVLSHTDWSVLGPYQAVAQLAVQMVTEVFNQYKAQIK